MLFIFHCLLSGPVYPTILMPGCWVLSYWILTYFFYGYFDESANFYSCYGS